MLRVLMLRKRINEKKKELEEARSTLAGMEKREADIAQAIEEASTEEEKAVVEEEIEKFEQEKVAAVEAEKNINEEVDKLEEELKSVEAEQATDPVPEEKPEEKEERKTEVKMSKRNIFAGLSYQERSAIFENDQVKEWVSAKRSEMKEKRAITNVGLTIPEVLLPLLKANIVNYSKLYDKVNVKRVNGEARQPIASEMSEGVWTECCAALNELSLVFNDWVVDCFEVGGFVAVCNANLEDSDEDLTADILEGISKAIGKAIDKAILYGRNTSANSHMPLGIIPRLVQTAAPADYPATARTWVDLHTTHVLSYAASVTDTALFKKLVEDSGIVANEYAGGEITWVMNEKTYKVLLAASMADNAAGALVASIDGTMPVVGGDVVVLNFVPDNVIIFGYFDEYLLAERAGFAFASSEHVRFIQNQTVFKGTARYDGAPIIAEGFAAVALKGGTVSATAVTFPQDSAN